VSGVTQSSALKWSVIVLLPLTIGWKLAIKPENPVEIQNAIVEFLANQQLDVRVTDERMEQMSVIEARSRLCRLRVSRVSPLGDETALVSRTSGESDRTFYVFQGSVYPQQPVRLTAMSYLWFRFFHELGLVSHVPPVLAVVTSCDAEQLPWRALGTQQAIVTR
jgi:hypothetical protein